MAPARSSKKKPATRKGRAQSESLSAVEQDAQIVANSTHNRLERLQERVDRLEASVETLGGINEGLIRLQERFSAAYQQTQADVARLSQAVTTPEQVSRLARLETLVEQLLHDNVAAKDRAQAVGAGAGTAASGALLLLYTLAQAWGLLPPGASP